MAVWIGVSVVGGDSATAAKAYMFSGSAGLLESCGLRQPWSTWWCKAAGARAPLAAESTASWAPHRTGVNVGSAARVCFNDGLLNYLLRGSHAEDCRGPEGVHIFAQSYLLWLDVGNNISLILAVIEVLGHASCLHCRIREDSHIAPTIGTSLKSPRGTAHKWWRRKLGGDWRGPEPRTGVGIVVAGEGAGGRVAGEYQIASQVRKVEVRWASEWWK